MEARRLFAWKGPPVPNGAARQIFYVCGRRTAQSRPSRSGRDGRLHSELELQMSALRQAVQEGGAAAGVIIDAAGGLSPPHQIGEVAAHGN